MDIVYSVAAALFFSLSVIFVRRGVSKIGVQTGTAIMLFAGTITLLLVAIISEDIQVLYSANFSGLLFFSLAGVIHFIGGWGFMNASTIRIGATRGSAMGSLTPLFAAILAFIFLGETINVYIILGILLLCIGIYLTITSRE